MPASNMADGDDFDFLFSPPSPVTTVPYFCPLCNSLLAVRTMKTGKAQFMGCPRYPNCQFACDTQTVSTRALTKQESSVVSLGGINPSIQEKRRAATERNERRIQAGQGLYPKTGGVIFDRPSINPTEVASMRKRIEDLEATVKELQEWIRLEKERREKFSIDL